MRRPDARRRKRLLAGLALLILALLAGGGALGAVYLYQQSQPTVVSLALHDGAREVALQPTLRFSTSRPLGGRDLQQSLQASPKADAVVRATDGGRAFTWTPRQPLAELTEYTLSVAPLQDSFGHRLKATRWRFTTTIQPRVVSVTAEGGATVPDQGEIPSGSRLIIGFNEPMNTSSVNLLANGSPAQLSWSADGRTASLGGASLPIGRLELSLGAGSRDSAGRPAGAWSTHLAVVFHVNIHTVPLRVPALVQVPNDPAAREQSGLQAADVVYEYLTEAEITRFTAVFTNAPDVVGPIRSGRLISFALTRQLHGMLFMSGLSSGSTARLDADPVPNVIDVPGIFYRTSDRVPPNNLYVRASSLQQNEERAVLPEATLEHGGAPAGDGEAAPAVAVPEHHSTYSFDPDTGTYTKSVEGRQMSDAALQQPLRIQLLVLMHTTATQTNYVEDVNGVHGLEFDMQSGGHADFYYGGRHLTGKWSASGRESPISYQLDSGAAVKLPSGLAWIDVLKG
jgi:Protein of unknown function (DUF3048) N-terminal domain/Protein of unknown function (DUF3048) C-terminal domain/Bacterial Ig-like domain